MLVIFTVRVGMKQGIVVGPKVVGIVCDDVLIIPPARLEPTRAKVVSAPVDAKWRKKRRAMCANETNVKLTAAEMRVLEQLMS